MSLLIANDPSGDNPPIPLMVGLDSYQSPQFHQHSAAFESLSAPLTHHSGYTFRPDYMPNPGMYPSDSVNWQNSQSPFPEMSGPIPLSPWPSTNQENLSFYSPQHQMRKKRKYKPIKSTKSENEELFIEYVLDKIIPASPELQPSPDFMHSNYPFSENHSMPADMYGNHPGYFNGEFPGQMQDFPNPDYPPGFHPNQQMIPVDPGFGMMPFPLESPQYPVPHDFNMANPMMHHPGQMPYQEPFPFPDPNMYHQDQFSMLHGDPGFGYGAPQNIPFYDAPQMHDNPFHPHPPIHPMAFPQYPYPDPSYPLPGLPLAPESGQDAGMVPVSRPLIHKMGNSGCVTTTVTTYHVHVPEPIFGTGPTKHKGEDEDLNTFLKILEKQGAVLPTEVPVLFSAHKRLKTVRKYNRIREKGFLERAEHHQWDVPGMLGSNATVSRDDDHDRS